MTRAAGLLMPVARNRIRFIEIAIRFRQSQPDIPCQETAPSFLNDGYPAEKSVIEVADSGFLNQDTLANSSVTVSAAIGVRQQPRGDVLDAITRR